MLTRKHFENAAAVVRNTDGTVGEVAAVCEAFVSFFQAENPRFDAGRFRVACQAVKPAPKARKPRGWEAVGIDTPQ